MSGFLLLLIQAVVYFVAMATCFYLRKRIGIGVFFCMIGVMHFLETYLAAVYFIKLPFGLISPGSTILFTGKLAVFLLLYIKEDAETMRQPTYGLLVGNIIMALLVLILRIYNTPAELSGYRPDLSFLDQMGLLMIWGTTLLFIDLISMVVLYEKLGTVLTRTIPGRIFASLAIVLSFDQLFFYLGLHYLSGVPPSALYGGWIAKMGSAAFFTLMVTLYLRFVEKDPIGAPDTALRDVFDRLTYRYRYEKLAEQVGRDPLTGLQNRGQFDLNGPSMLKSAARSGTPIGLLMIDIDRFKAVNDQYGHPVGDRVIRDVVTTIAAAARDTDRLFRYGGEEFALLCPDMAPGALFGMAERIRQAVARAPHPDLPYPVTISVGIACHPSDAQDFPTLLARADAALYLAKSLGRDRVYLAT